MPTYPLPTLAAQVSATGISAPAFEDLVNSDVATYQGIYGSDVLLEPDDQDYQLLAARCAAINDANQLAIAVYNSFHPAYAQGVGLSAAVQINGLNREVATNSTALLTIVGQAKTIIQGGVVKDLQGNLWNLPLLVTIPDAGTIDVSATAQQAGAISAGFDTITIPYTIIPGWQTVTNAASAAPGAPIESDAALRARQSRSTALPSQGPLDAIMAAVANSGGVTRSIGYENTGNLPDANSVPGHTIAVVVEGGNATTIATLIQQKKAPGTGTYGTTSITLFDQGNLPVTIKFFEVADTQIYAAMTIHPLNGYVLTTGLAAVAALVGFINALEIGEEVYYNWLLGIAGLNNSPLGQTFVITALTIGLAPGSLAAANIPIAFNAAAQCSTGNVVLTTS